MSNMEKIIINREASDKSKGFILQKLRTISLILKKLENNKDAIILAAVEFKRRCLFKR